MKQMSVSTVWELGPLELVCFMTEGLRDICVAAEGARPPVWHCGMTGQLCLVTQSQPCRLGFSFGKSAFS